MSEYKSKDSSSVRRETAQLTELMTERLQDKSIVNRYGTSLKVSMGRDYTNYLNERYQKLKEEFNKIDKNSDQELTFEEYFDFFAEYQKETGIELTRDYLQDVFDFMDQDQGSTITIQEFIFSYMVIEEKLRHKKIHLQQVIDEYSSVMKRYNKNISDNKEEKINNFGISNSAELTISILDAMNLKPTNFSGTVNPYALIIFDGVEKTTDVIEGTFNPVWNENFEFKIRSLESLLEIRVVDKISNDVIGVCRLSLKEFLDQSLFEKTINLNPSSGSEFMGELRIRIRVFWSKLKYFKEKLMESEEKIESAKKEQRTVQGYLDIIENKPFGLIVLGQIINLRDEDVLEEPKEKEEIMDKARLSIMPSHSQIKTNSNIANKIDKIVGGTLKKNVEWSNISKTFMYFLLIFSCLQMIERPDFIGLLMGVGIWYLFLNNQNIHTLEILDQIRNFLDIMLVAIVYDFIWLFFHYKGFWKDELADKTIKEMTYLFAVLNFFVKIGLCFSLWINFSKERYKKKEKQFYEARKTVSDFNRTNADKGRFSVANFFKGDKGESLFRKQDIV